MSPALTQGVAKQDGKKLILHSFAPWPTAALLPAMPGIQRRANGHCQHLASKPLTPKSRAGQDYAPTPLIALPGLARELGVGELLYKEERHRLGLNSFKALGGAYAVMRVLAKELARRGVTEPVTSELLAAGRWRDMTKNITVALRDRRQPRPLGRLGRAHVRLPLRDLHPCRRQRRARRGDRSLRRRGDPRRWRL